VIYSSAGTAESLQPPLENAMQIAVFCRVLSYQASCFWVLQGPCWACKPAMQLIVVLACLVAQVTGVQQPVFLNGGGFWPVKLAGVEQTQFEMATQ